MFLDILQTSAPLAGRDVQMTLCMYDGLGGIPYLGSEYRLGDISALELGARYTLLEFGLH